MAADCNADTASTSRWCMMACCEQQQGEPAGASVQAAQHRLTPLPGVTVDQYTSRNVVEAPKPCEQLKYLPR